MFLRRSERLSNKLERKYASEYSVITRQIDSLTAALINPSHSTLTLSSIDFTRIRIQNMTALMKIFNNKLAFIMHFVCKRYNDNAVAKLMKNIYKNTFRWFEELQKLISKGEAIKENPDVRRLEKYLHKFRKTYTIYRHQKWGHIFETLDDNIVNIIDGYF